MERFKSFTCISIKEAVEVLENNIIQNADIIRIVEKQALPPMFQKSMNAYSIGPGVMVIYDMFSPSGKLTDYAWLSNCSHADTNSVITEIRENGLINIPGDFDMTNQDILQISNKIQLSMQTVYKDIIDNASVLSKEDEPFVKGLLNNNDGWVAQSLSAEWENYMKGVEDLYFFGTKLYEKDLISICSVEKMITYKNRQLYSLNNIFVHEQYRKMGYGKKLLNSVLWRYSGDWLYCADEDNIASINTALTCGFKKVGFIKGYKKINKSL